MAIIKDKDRAALTQLAEKMTRDVDVTFYTQRDSALVVPGVVPCETCNTTEELLNELSSIIPKLHVSTLDLVSSRAEAERDGVNRVPTMVVGGAAERRVRFMGFPGGYEFATFMTALLEAGGAGEEVPEPLKNSLASIEKPIDIKVFVTPS